jgi:hypothetical protein
MDVSQDEMERLSKKCQCQLKYQPIQYENTFYKHP